ncbi:hypothetical protein [Methylobacterium sp. SyP6R]|uniref:hypothetical protein n=1 Tax=Methylobacterium sp. SyP6R TaxID=2718876 RepID=UPI001F1CAF09|nr:hypothetical protein [Methylobacterium sp. SyP6R]MCF4124870.1 hypothetical protein [Methylobacterium sp. SyP6R]
MDASSGKIISLSNLSDKEDCFPSTLKGKIVKREFDRSGFNIESIILEKADGTRTFVNAGDNRGDDAVTVGNVKRGLETMLKEGRNVVLGVWACGAAGRVLRIHSVRSAN